MKRCPVCGQNITVTGTDAVGRTIGSCGDAFWATTDTLGRTTFHARCPKTYCRTDLWAVKTFEDTGKRGNWVLTHIFRSQAAAEQCAKDTAENIHRDYPLVSPKVYHPQYWEVEYFLTVGNRIV